MQALKVNLRVANHRLPIHPLKSETFDLPVRGPLPMNQFSTGKFTKEYYNHTGYWHIQRSERYCEIIMRAIQGYIH